MERCLEMLVGLLGILKAGGAYLPLDPAYPKDRLAFMVEDSGAVVLLTQAHLLEKLPRSGVPVVLLDRAFPALTRECEETPVSRLTAGNLSYVIYTSGSTGKPKGVAMGHRALTNLISWQLTRSTGLPLRALQFASLSFDVSLQEIFSAWCGGGTLVLTSEDDRRDPSNLLHCLLKEAVERLFLPFVALQQLALAFPGAELRLPALREVITAGEQLRITTPILNLFKGLEAALQNQYGPSESHVVTAYSLAGAPQDWPKLPAIGRPIANVRIHVLDQHMERVPVGVVGELYIAGTGTGRGYANRSGETAERFLPEAFGNGPGLQMYRSGDLVRYAADGELEFLGRVDEQTKIRGHRVEPGEVETLLGQHPAVQGTVVVAHEEPTSHGPLEAGTLKTEGKRLVGYIVLKQEPTAALGDIRGFLEKRLPEYMIPSTFELLEFLPLTPNGKVNRRALPEPQGVRPDLAGTYVPPRDLVEEKLEAIWRELLGVDRVGVHDNFFALGGHSLLATQLVSRIRIVFEVEVALRSVFELPTIAGLAENIRMIGICF